jgi:predicted ferric reductase
MGVAGNVIAQPTQPAVATAGAPSSPTGIVAPTSGSAAVGQDHRSDHRRSVSRLLLIVVAVGLGVTWYLAVSAESSGSLAAPGGVLTALGRFAGLTGTYLLLLMVVLVARLPVLERAVGQDRLVRWHRRLGPWPISLLAAHGVLITVGYAQQSRTGAFHELGVLLSSYPDVLAATVAFGLLIVAGITSWRVLRRKLRYETWWAIHLYFYLALALSFAHQITNGASFVGHPLARLYWTALWLATAGAVAVYRVAVPVRRSLRHRLRIVDIRHEAPGVVSVICRGHHLERLAVSGGQFLQWRFLARGLWWQAHPYSLSAMPVPPFARLTVKTDGDHGAELSRLRRGTWVAIEGPYGAFTKEARTNDAVVLFAAGVGVTPVRALLEDLPLGVDVVVVLRASTNEEVILRQEVAELVAARSGVLYELIGPRSLVSTDSASLARLVPDIADRDVYVCGPTGYVDAVVDAARTLGTAAHRIHHEAFEF